jgi:hypothetical protein
VATPTPFQLANRKAPQIVTTNVYTYDPYNFPQPPARPGASTSFASGLWQGIPACGPHAAGAPPPTKFLTVAETVITITGSVTPDYGNNRGNPQ